jgi:hypothetical protein
MPRITEIDKKSYMKKDGTAGIKTTARFEGDNRYIGFFDAFPFQVGDFVTFTLKQSKDGKYWNGYDAVKGHEAMPDPLANTGTPFTPPSTVKYEGSPDIISMGLDELIAERNNAITKGANVAYIGQLNNLIIQENHHVKLMTYLGSILQILQRLQGVAK